MAEAVWRLWDPGSIEGPKMGIASPHSRAEGAGQEQERGGVYGRNIVRSWEWGSVRIDGAGLSPTCLLRRGLSK